MTHLEKIAITIAEASEPDRSRAIYHLIIEVASLGHAYRERGMVDAANTVDAVIEAAGQIAVGKL